MSKRKKSRLVKQIWFSLGIIASIVIGYLIAKVNHEINSVLNIANRDGIDLSDVEVDTSKLLYDDSVINILLVGADKRESWSEAGRSDSVMIATMDLKHKRLKVTSLMRDMYVEIPGYQNNRFNAAYSFGGTKLLYQTIARNFNIRLDGYVIVDFQAFKAVINHIGGVEITLTDAEQEYLVKKYQNKKGTVAQVQKGTNILDGSQALAYTRIRQDAQGDFGRTKRQRNVLQAIFTKVKTMSYNKVLDLASLVMEDVTTDLTNEEIMDYVAKVVFMGTTQIDQLRIPLDNTYTQDRIRNMAVLLPDFSINSQALYEFIYEYDGENKQQ